MGCRARALTWYWIYAWMRLAITKPCGPSAHPAAPVSLPSPATARAAAHLVGHKHHGGLAEQVADLDHKLRVVEAEVDHLVKLRRHDGRLWVPRATAAPHHQPTWSGCAALLVPRMLYAPWSRGRAP
jgi:hypothetical protein